MFPPFLGCGDAGSVQRFRRQHLQRKLASLTFWRDGLERQLAAINAAISTLERQLGDSAES
ncbi:MAG: hypothetical protein RLZZ219_1968 [Cyanobacteriota bacterium]|jgi:hypothetical protein